MQVRASDTLAHVAVKFGLTVPELRALNRLLAPAIFPGQKLRVRGAPAESTRPKPEPLQLRHDPSTALGPLSPTEAIRRVGKSTFFRPQSETPLPESTPRTSNSDLASFHADLEEL